GHLVEENTLSITGGESVAYPLQQKVGGVSQVIMNERLYLLLKPNSHQLLSWICHLFHSQKGRFGCRKLVLIFPAREQVRIGVHRQIDGGMAKPLLHHLWRKAQAAILRAVDAP